MKLEVNEKMMGEDKEIEIYLVLVIFQASQFSLLPVHKQEEREFEFVDTVLTLTSCYCLCAICYCTYY